MTSSISPPTIMVLPLGVKCDKVLKTLLDNDLIYEAGRLNKIGKPIIYKTSQEFLKVLEIESLDDLPKLASE